MKNTYDKIMDSMVFLSLSGLILVAIITLMCFFGGCGFPNKHLCNSKCQVKAKPKQLTKGTPVCHEECYFKSFQVKKGNKGISCYKF